MRTKLNSNQLLVAFKAHRSTSAQTFNHDTLNVVIFDTPSFNSNGGYDLTTGIYTVSYFGKYLISYQVSVLAGGTAPGIIQTYINMNTSTTIQVTNNEMALVASKRWTGIGTVIQQLNVGDTIKVGVYSSGQNVTSDTNGIQYTFLNIARIGL